MSEYPEHEKLHEVKDRSQAIGEFLDYSKFTLCEYREPPEGTLHWIDERTGTGKTPRGREVTIFGEHTVANPEWFEPGYYPTHMSITTILAAWFDIDQDKLEAEKREMLDKIRKTNDRAA